MIKRKSLQNYLLKELKELEEKGNQSENDFKKTIEAQSEELEKEVLEEKLEQVSEIQVNVSQTLKDIMNTKIQTNEFIKTNNINNLTKVLKEFQEQKQILNSINFELNDMCKNSTLNLKPDHLKFMCDLEKIIFEQKQKPQKIFQIENKINKIINKSKQSFENHPNSELNPLKTLDFNVQKKYYQSSKLKMLAQLKNLLEESKETNIHSQELKEKFEEFVDQGGQFCANFLLIKPRPFQDYWERWRDLDIPKNLEQKQ